MKAIIICGITLLLVSSVEARHARRARHVAPASSCMILCDTPQSEPRRRLLTPNDLLNPPQRAHYRRLGRRGRVRATHDDRTRTNAPGIIRSRRGSTAYVASHAAHHFQCLVDALETQGYPIRFMGGWRAHGSVRHSLHPMGLAVDINQLSRDVTVPRMPSNEIALANACGLISGAQWRHGDSGHFQLGGYAGRRHR